MSDARLKLIFACVSGLIATIALVVLVGLIALRQVEEKTSYGLMPLVVALSNMCVMFGGWAWKAKEDSDGDNGKSITGSGE